MFVGGVAAAVVFLLELVHRSHTLRVDQSHSPMHQTCWQVRTNFEFKFICSFVLIEISAGSRWRAEPKNQPHTSHPQPLNPISSSFLQISGHQFLHCVPRRVGSQSHTVRNYFPHDPNSIWSSSVSGRMKDTGFAGYLLFTDQRRNSKQ